MALSKIPGSGNPKPLDPNLVKRATLKKPSPSESPKTNHKPPEPPKLTGKERWEQRQIYGGRGDAATAGGVPISQHPLFGKQPRSTSPTIDQPQAPAAGAAPDKKPAAHSPASLMEQPQDTAAGAAPDKKTASTPSSSVCEHDQYGYVSKRVTTTGGTTVTEVGFFEPKKDGPIPLLDGTRTTRTGDSTLVEEGKFDHDPDGIPSEMLLGKRTHQWDSKSDLKVVQEGNFWDGRPQGEETTTITNKHLSVTITATLYGEVLIPKGEASGTITFQGETTAFKTGVTFGDGGTFTFDHPRMQKLPGILSVAQDAWKKVHP